MDFNRKHRRQSSQQIALEPEVVEEQPDPKAEDPLEDLCRPELEPLVREWIAELDDPKSQQILTLRLFKGEPFEKIAETVGLAKSTVEARLDKLLEKLRRHLRGLGWDPRG